MPSQAIDALSEFPEPLMRIPKFLRDDFLHQGQINLVNDYKSENHKPFDFPWTVELIESFVQAFKEGRLKGLEIQVIIFPCKRCMHVNSYFVTIRSFSWDLLSGDKYWTPARTYHNFKYCVCAFHFQLRKCWLYYESKSYKYEPVRGTSILNIFRQLRQAGRRLPLYHTWHSPQHHGSKNSGHWNANTLD